MQTVKDIFAPTAGKVIASLGVALFWHIYLVEQSWREAAGQGLAEAQHFWISNLVNALPYVRTDNTLLKFLTFFAISYALIWLVSKTVSGLDRLQIATIRKLRKTR